MSKQAKVIETKEFKQLIAAVSITRHALRNKTMIYVSYYAGARACEIAALRVSDVLGESGDILDVVTLAADQTKGKSRCRLFINKQLRKYLTQYIAANPRLSANQEQPLFFTQKSAGFSPQTVINLFAGLYKKAFIAGASSHSGRRTFITNLAERGVNPRIIQKLARHSSLNTTMVYIDVNDLKLSSAVELARV